MSNLANLTFQKYFKSWRLMNTALNGQGVDFINVLQAAFTREDPENNDLTVFLRF